MFKRQSKIHNRKNHSFNSNNNFYSIVGYISHQLFTLIQTTEPKYLRQINIDLSTPFFLIHQPKKVFKNKDNIHPTTKVLTKAIPPFFTCWDCLEIKGNEIKTVNDVINYINEKYQVDIWGLYTLNSNNIIKDDSSYEMNFEKAYFEAIGMPILSPTISVS